MDEKYNLFSAWLKGNINKFRRRASLHDQYTSSTSKFPLNLNKLSEQERDRIVKNDMLFGDAMRGFFDFSHIVVPFDAHLARAGLASSKDMDLFTRKVFELQVPPPLCACSARSDHFSCTRQRSLASIFREGPTETSIRGVSSFVVEYQRLATNGSRSSSLIALFLSLSLPLPLPLSLSLLPFFLCLSLCFHIPSLILLHHSRELTLAAALSDGEATEQHCSSFHQEDSL